MHNILEKLLRKRKINSFNELDAEEKATFENWDRILSKKELTLEDVKQFCSSQITVIEHKWADNNINQYTKAELIPYHTVYKAILNSIGSPQIVREALEKQLLGMLN